MKLQQIIDDLLDRLSMVPERIARAVAGIPEPDKNKPLSKDEWSAAEILAHLRASDDIVAYRLYAILARDLPFLPAYDERRWAEVAGYAHTDFDLSLKTYALRRMELVNMLRMVALDDWKRLGTHEVKGRVSLLDIATSLVEHEEEHCLQLNSIH
jgi:hypothetical protein